MMRTNQVDYKSVKQDGREVGSPEAFLREIFTELQLNPVEFLEMSEKQQNAIILDMIEYPWDVMKIKEWFGEIPAWVNYDQNILSVLNDIQSEKGEYFMHRQDVNRDIRNKRAFIEEIAATIPEGYNLSVWEVGTTKYASTKPTARLKRLLLQQRLETAVLRLTRTLRGCRSKSQPFQLRRTG